MIRLVPLDREAAAALRDIRLRALMDAPFAFASTHARESALTAQEWEERAVQWSGETSATWLAWDGDDLCGIAGVYLDRDRAHTANLVSVWIAPDRRRRGLATTLIETIVAWAESKKAQTMRLLVASTNDPAIALYERLGFVRSGGSEPHPAYPDRTEIEMLRRLEPQNGP